MLLDLASGEYYELKGAGPFVWSLLDGATTLGEIADRLVEGYGVSAELAAPDLQSFLRELAERRLLEGTAEAGPGNGATRNDPEVVAPTLEYAAPCIESRGNLKYLGQLD